MTNIRHWSWNDSTKLLTVYCRESSTPIWERSFETFEDAQDCANSFIELYDQGVRHGKQLALEEIRRTIDHIDRSI